MSLTMVHSNPARVDNGVFSVDRKFHLGMQAYAHAIRTPLLTVHNIPVPAQAMHFKKPRRSTPSFSVLWSM